MSKPDDLFISIPVTGPLHHDLNQVNATLLSAMSSYAVKHRLSLDAVGTFYLGVRNIMGKPTAYYAVRNINRARA